MVRIILRRNNKKRIIHLQDRPVRSVLNFLDFYMKKVKMVCTKVDW